ncbi:hypothetical protein [Marinimicrococcus flavescens]|uniref:Uncharacterized protein n=1 Tax=Marinimicrococcus flavescens TaxID=3031815 RepID=A0AAP3XTF7_9PROT|nr:hypothetical protein [Marinimicrococcus flavescens]
MPHAPSVAQSDASRFNGALSRGPVTPEGKAASAGNGQRHGLFSETLALEPAEETHFQGLLDSLGARHRPADEVESYWVRQMAICMVRTERLNALELRVLDAALEGAGAVREARLPSPATVLRYRARLQRDHEHAARELAAAKAQRRPAEPEKTNPRTDMAAQLAQVEAAAAADTERFMARLLAMRGAEGKVEPDGLPSAGLNRAQRRRQRALSASA